MPGLVPGIEPTPALARAWCRIAATPAFAGAGKCRDDMRWWDQSRFHPAQILAVRVNW
jgi:hypothetical protein